MTALVGIIMGSQSDWPILRHAAETLDQLSVRYERRITSAHRTPDITLEYSASAAGRGLRAIIAGAGGAAHLAGVVAAKTILPDIPGYRSGREEVYGDAGDASERTG